MRRAICLSILRSWVRADAVYSIALVKGIFIISRSLWTRHLLHCLRPGIGCDPASLQTVTQPLSSRKIPDLGVPGAAQRLGPESLSGLRRCGIQHPRHLIQIHPDLVEFPELGHLQPALGRDGRCHSRSGVGSRLFILAGKALCAWLHPRARRGMPPDLPRFRMALSPSAPEIAPLRGSERPVSAERIGTGDFRPSDGLQGRPAAGRARDPPCSEGLGGLSLEEGEEEKPSRRSLDVPTPCPR